jgi:hypothetical protein
MLVVLFVLLLCCRCAVAAGQQQVPHRGRTPAGGARGRSQGGAGQRKWGQLCVSTHGLCFLCVHVLGAALPCAMCWCHTHLQRDAIHEPVVAVLILHLCMPLLPCSFLSQTWS